MSGVNEDHPVKVAVSSPQRPAPTLEDGHDQGRVLVNMLHICHYNL